MKEVIKSFIHTKKLQGLYAYEGIYQIIYTRASCKTPKCSPGETWGYSHSTLLGCPRCQPGVLQEAH